jgi:Flp pilus assembly protein TadG
MQIRWRPPRSFATSPMTPLSPARETSAVRACQRGGRLQQRLTARGEDGGYIATEAAIILPFLLLITFALVQGGIWFYARSAALNAAQEALQAARSQDGSTAAAVGVAEGFLARAGDGVITDPATRVDASPTSITVTVSGNSLKIVDFIPLPRFEQSVTGARERFTTN